MNGVAQILAKFGPARLAAMGAVTLALMGFFALVMMRVSQPAMGVLFSELSSSDASAVTRELDTRGIRYEARDDGQTILVPKAELQRLRMDLAGKGLPLGGGVGYEIFDKGDAFTSTSFVQNINHLRALEGELSRTIRTIGRVSSARVHLALPERRLFSRDKESARASVVLKLRGELGGDQVLAIRHLVASAVEGLTPENISIIDERGRLLANGNGESNPEGVGASEDKRIALERRLRSRVEEIVGGIVGIGRSRVQVSAELDTSRIESRQESFDPESRVVRSTQTRGEASNSGAGEGQVSVGNELPGAKDAAPSAAQRDQSNKTEETVNYEISKTVRTEVQQAGRVKKLSIAVLVDGSYARGQNGEATYRPRSPEDLERIAALVRSAVGFDKARGDQVEVVNLPIAESAASADPEKTPLLASLLSPSREDILRWAELGVTALLTLLVLLVVVRPMVRRVISPEAAPLLAGPAGAAAETGVAGAPAQIVGPGGAVGAAGTALAGAAGAAQLSLPDGSVAATGGPDPVARLGDLARQQPKQAAAVLRGWMAEQ